MAKLVDIASNVATSVEQGKLLLEASTKVVRTNFYVFSMIHDLHDCIRQIPWQVKREQPVIFLDLFNRTLPFHLEFITRKEELLAMLSMKFKAAGCRPEMLH